MPRTPALVAVVAAALLAGATPAAAVPHESDVDRWRTALDALVAAGTPGALAHVEEPGRAWTGTSGVADLRTGRPMPRDARFRIASVTKSMVAVVVLQLVAEHRLGLDDPVGSVLPDVVTGADRITVRQLLDHTSGLADYMSASEFADPAVYTKRHYRPAQLIAFAERLGPVAAPGVRFSYANTNYIVLGLLVEHLTGRALGTVLRERIFAPLGLRATSFPLTDPTIPGPHAEGYQVAASGDLVRMTELDPSFEWAAFAVISTGHDVDRFFQALFSGRLVPRPLLDQMRVGSPTGSAPVFPRYGLGLESMGLTCGETWGATGETRGFETLAASDGRRSITVSINVDRADAQAGPVILAAVNVINEYFCAEPYRLPVA